MLSRMTWFQKSITLVAPISGPFLHTKIGDVFRYPIYGVSEIVPDFGVQKWTRNRGHQRDTNGEKSSHEGTVFWRSEAKIR